MARTTRTFPLRVDQEWLDKVEKYRDKSETKHEFVLKAVKKEINRREQETNENE